MHSVSKLSVFLLGVLVTLAVYAGGSAAVLIAIGPSGAPPPPTNIINLTNHTVGDNDNEAVGVDFELNFSGACGGTCGGVMETSDNSVFTAINDEWATNWQASTYANCVGSAYEIKWTQISGTLTDPPFGISETLPAGMWSKTEWGDSLALCDANWFTGVFPGPAFGQAAAAADTVIEISIREIAFPANSGTAQFTFTP